MALSKTYTTEESGFRPPAVVHFKGICKEITDESRPNRAGDKNNNFFVFDFVDIEVIESTEPYTFPTFKVEVIELNMANTQWDAMKKSLREDCHVEGSIDQIVDKTCELHWKLALLSQRNSEGTYENKLSNCWQFVAVDGIDNTGDQLMTWCVDNANNKIASKFKADYLAEASIKNLTGFGKTTISVMQDQLLPTFVQGGLLTVDDNGIYHKVG